MLVVAKNLQLADVIRRPGCESPYGCGTVKSIEDGHAIVFRPYVHTADFSYTGGVICYIGFEMYPVPMNDDIWELLERKELN